MASFDMAMSGQTSQPKQKSYSKVLHTKRAIRGLICILFCLLSLLPFLLMVMNATRTSGDIQAGVTLIPSSHLMENWNMLLQKQNGMRLTLGRAMLNSLCITVPGTFLAVYCSCMTAYGIHVYNFKAKKFAWAFIMAIMMVPNQITIIGFYRFMLKLNLVDTYIPLIIPAIASPGTVFFLRQYVLSVMPPSLIEAARIDGASELYTFHRIAIPIMSPGIATMSIMGFIGGWNAYLLPMIILNKNEKFTLPVMMATLRASTDITANQGAIYLAVAISVIPILLVFAFFSKYIISSISAGAVKE